MVMDRQSGGHNWLLCTSFYQNYPDAITRHTSKENLFDYFLFPVSECQAVPNVCQNEPMNFICFQVKRIDNYVVSSPDQSTLCLEAFQLSFTEEPSTSRSNPSDFKWSIKASDGLADALELTCRYQNHLFIYGGRVHYNSRTVELNHASTPCTVLNFISDDHLHEFENSRTTNALLGLKIPTFPHKPNLCSSVDFKTCKDTGKRLVVWTLCNNAVDENQSRDLSISRATENSHEVDKTSRAKASLTSSNVHDSNGGNAVSEKSFQEEGENNSSSDQKKSESNLENNSSSDQKKSESHLKNNCTHEVPNGNDIDPNFDIISSSGLSEDGQHNHLNRIESDENYDIVSNHGYNEITGYSRIDEIGSLEQLNEGLENSQYIFAEDVENIDNNELEITAPNQNNHMDEYNSIENGLPSASLQETQGRLNELGVTDPKLLIANKIFVPGYLRPKLQKCKGTRYRYDTLKDLDDALMQQIQNEAEQGTVPKAGLSMEKCCYGIVENVMQSAEPRIILVKILDETLRSVKVRICTARNSPEMGPTPQIGDVIRLHRVNVQIEFDGSSDTMVLSTTPHRNFVLFRPENDEIKYLTCAKTFTLTELDEGRVQELFEYDLRRKRILEEEEQLSFTSLDSPNVPNDVQYFDDIEIKEELDSLLSKSSDDMGDYTQDEFLPKTPIVLMQQEDPDLEIGSSENHHPRSPSSVSSSSFHTCEIIGYSTATGEPVINSEKFVTNPHPPSASKSNKSDRSSSSGSPKRAKRNSNVVPETPPSPSPRPHKMTRTYTRSQSKDVSPPPPRSKKKNQNPSSEKQTSSQITTRKNKKQRL